MKRVLQSPTKTPRRARQALPAFALIFVAVLGLSCVGDDEYFSDGGGGPDGLPFDLTGSWTGTWTDSTGESRTFSCDLVQDHPTEGGGSPANVSGTATLDGSPCFDLLNVDVGFNPGGFVTSPYFYGWFTADSGTIEVFAGVMLDSESFGGNYEVIEEGACTRETGTFEASLSIPLHAPEVLGESVTVYDDQGNSTTFVHIEGVDPLTGRSRWAQRHLVLQPAHLRSGK